MHRHSSQEPLGQIVVDAEPAILDVAAQRIPSAQRILERLAEWRLSGEPSSLHHRPGVERIEQRLASRLSCRQALLDGFAVDVGLNRIDGLDASQRLFGDWRLGALEYLEELPPGVCRTGDVGDLRRLVARWPDRAPRSRRRRRHAGSR